MMIPAAVSALMLACAGSAPEVAVTVSNPAEGTFESQTVELAAAEILERLGTRGFEVRDVAGEVVPSQLTHDSLIIFRATVAAGGQAVYHIAGLDTMPQYPAVACGRVYPERADDVAWENELVGFRVYGPATKAKGERAYGYDIFLKHRNREPILERLYGPETSPEVWARVDSLRAIDPALADEYINTFSYHVDHGLGMDCYAVGPTLGAGVAALMDGDEIVYPWCYRHAEILDNGPVRFTLRLDFAPITVGTDSTVVEHRIISLDEGAQLNRCRVWYDGLSGCTAVAAGIPLRDNPETFVCGCMAAVADPTQGPDNGKALIGIVMDSGSCEPVYTDGHLLLADNISAGRTLDYMWGFAWDREGEYPDIQSWSDYLRKADHTRQNPFKINY